MTIASTSRLRTLIADLQREIGVSIECGQLVLNFNQSVCASIDVQQHARVLPIDARNPLTATTPERRFAGT